MKILGVRWIGGTTTIGVVCYENEMGKRSVAIATVPGYNEETDAVRVSEWGAKLTYLESIGFFPSLITEENFKFK